ncbi:hypothetical protein sscle_06g053850 [Sclerotinia sclerotiorum 1980 UF-70]|uniref:HTH CENPB-type domain-containing protein n=1 Tax=Sclerotinia sclerotiorum (strain ATCC 18683 / 1980 / Ss-1) TaxID=665079 RepID=A0A1D9Q6R3_SCLS1|nr:hypothetical protein sscle_06g053850 [Sclerotinia sclerotiorum 1980 UF-70]
MEIHSKEARIILAIEAIELNKRLTIRKAANYYSVPRSTLFDRIQDRSNIAESRPKSHNLIELEEEVLIQYIIDMDDRGFAPKLNSVEDMANYMLETRGAKKIGKLWAHCFVKRRLELKMRFSVLKCSYSCQIEGFIKAHINHISKVEFFIVFKAAYQQSITIQNMKAGFRGAGLIPFDPQSILSKLDIRIRTSTPSSTSLELTNS